MALQSACNVAQPAPSSICATDRMASFLVGTFNTPELFHLYFDANKSTLTLLETYPAHGNHSWLAFDQYRRNLYATAWTEPSCIASYRVQRKSTPPSGTTCPEYTSISIELLNTAPTRARSGYVAVGRNPENVVYTVGGPTGEVLRLNKDCGSFETSSTCVQELDFIKGHVSNPLPAKNGVGTLTNGHGHGLEQKILDFGGLRHGSHSIDLSPDGSIAYVADIGRNCIWVYSVCSKDGTLTLSQKSLCTRPNDGPRHVWPHPNGEVVYVLEEHSCFVDVYRVHRPAKSQPICATQDVGSQTMEVQLVWIQGVRIVPAHLSHTLFWADEVRLSPGERPCHLLASTRGLASDTKGYVALFALDDNGEIVEQKGQRTEEKWLDMWQSPASGGWANAIEPCHSMLRGPDGKESTYAALTDSDTGSVIVLQVKGDELVKVAQLDLGQTHGRTRGAATAVWL